MDTQNPAHAGMNPENGGLIWHLLAKPRSRGDEPGLEDMTLQGVVKTPLTRG